MEERTEDFDARKIEAFQLNTKKLKRHGKKSNFNKTYMYSCIYSYVLKIRHTQHCMGDTFAKSFPQYLNGAITSNV